MQKRIRTYTPIKRAIDVLLSGIGILVLSPILLILCVAIKLDSPGQILFTQKRVGIHKSYFRIYKFRTHADRHTEGHADPYAEQSGTVYYPYRQFPTQNQSG